MRRGRAWTRNSGRTASKTAAAPAARRRCGWREFRKCSSRRSTVRGSTPPWPKTRAVRRPSRGRRGQACGWSRSGSVAAGWVKRGPWSSRPVARRHSASGWFSGRALSKAGSFRQAASTATIFGKAVERHLQPPRIEDLRHQADVGERHVRAAGIGAGRDHGLDRLEAFDHPMVVPGVDLRLLVLELTLDVLQRDEIVERMNIASDHLRDARALWRVRAHRPARAAARDGSRRDTR